MSDHYTVDSQTGKEPPWEARGERHFEFRNNRGESYFAVAVWHDPSVSMWERIFIARDDGELGERIARLPELEVKEREGARRILELEQRLADCDILLSEASILTQARADIARAKNAELMDLTS